MLLIKLKRKLFSEPSIMLFKFFDFFQREHVFASLIFDKSYYGIARASYKRLVHAQRDNARVFVHKKCFQTESVHSTPYFN